MRKFPLIILLLSAALTANPADLLDRSSGLAGLACGGAGTARTDVISAPYWNPAGLAFNTKSGVEFSYYQNMGLVNHTSLDGVLLIDEYLPLGLNFVQESISDIPLTSEANGQAVEEGVFSDEYNFFNIASAFNLSPGLYGGVNFKIISHSIFEDSASGMGMDLGLLQMLGKDLKAGLTFRNLFSNLDWSTGLQENLARKLTAGVAYHQLILDKHNYFFIDADVFSEDIYSWGLGMESWIVDDMFCLRGGINSREEFSLGTGFKYSDFHCDLALLLHEQSKYLEDTVLFGLGFDFKMPQAKPKSSDINFSPDIASYGNILTISRINTDEVVEIALLNSDYDVVNLPVKETVVVRVASGNYTLFFQLNDQQIVQKTVTVE